MKAFLFACLLAVSSCSTVYYKFWETFGLEKRDLLQSNVKKANKNQEELKEQFGAVLERIQSEYSFDGGDLEETYESLSADYQSAEAKSEALKDRIDKVEDIGRDLFKEWEAEAKYLGNKNYRQDSLRKLKDTQKRFDSMLSSMRKVEENLDSLLKNFHDQVIYLKHNLNARALGAFKTEFKSVEREMRNLMKEITRSSKSAEKFIKKL